MRAQSTLLTIALIVLVTSVLEGQEKARAPFFSRDGDVTMMLQMEKPSAELLSNYGPPDKKEPFTWRNRPGELWSYLRTTITTNSKARPHTLACVRQFYVEPANLLVHGTWSTGYCSPPYDLTVIDTLTTPSKP